MTLASAFPNLVHLRVNYILDDPVDDPSLLNSLLRNCPHLETLRITGDGYLRLHQHAGTLVPIRLPALHAISLSYMPVASALSILACIEPSAMTKIKLTGLICPPRDDVLDLDILPRSIAALQSVAGLTHLDMAIGVDDSAMIGTWDTLQIIASGPLTGVWFDFEDALVHYDSVQRLFCQTVDTRGITTLRIATCGTDRHNEDQFVRLSDAMLADMPSVSQLVLREPGSARFGLDVDHTMDSVRNTLAVAPDSSKVPLPRLESLRIEVPVLEKPEYERLVEGMACTSRARERVGHPIRSMTVSQSLACVPAGVDPPMPSEDGCTVAVAEDDPWKWRPLQDMANRSVWSVSTAYWEVF